jgi:tetratricopeptide (TPR) repeat protein
MEKNPYAPCPCGSGKKFKWCCHALYLELGRAEKLLANGQIEAALNVFDRLIQDHPGHAILWVHKAETLLDLDRKEEAEQALDRALEINPDLAPAYYLRGTFRMQEGEYPGALHLFRQAARLAPPSDRLFMHKVYHEIYRCEVLNRRLYAALAAAEIALRYNPTDTDLREHVHSVFTPGNARYPESACQLPAYLPPPQSIQPSASATWTKAISLASEGRLEEALQSFEQLAEENPEEPATWFNLGLCRATLGQNSAALEALDRYVALVPDDESAVKAWKIAEVLRFAVGMTAESDWITHYALFEVLDPEALYHEMSTDFRCLLVNVESGNSAVGLVLDRPFDKNARIHASFELPKVLCRFQWMVPVGYLVLTSLRREACEEGRAYLESLAGSALRLVDTGERTSDFLEVPSDSLLFLSAPGLSKEQADKFRHEVVHARFETEWLNRPLRSLGGVAPVDATGHPILRRKLMAAVDFLEEMTECFQAGAYDFDRLRHKLGLPTRRPVGVSQEGIRDISALNVAELAALPVEDLSDSDLASAFQASRRLDAQELAGRFAEAIVNRPPTEATRDRFPYYTHLAQLAGEQDDFVRAREWVEAGMRYDCEHNEGRRRNDYDLRLAQLFTRAGQFDEAEAAYNRLTERTPSDLDLLGNAAEAMLQARRQTQAADFAQRGLGAAKAKGDRDRAAYFEELLAAARR